MERLRRSLSERGLAQVRTYIQSGNVLVDAGTRSEQQVTDLIETTLRKDFDVATVVVAITSQTLLRTVSTAPPGFGAQPDVFHSDVVFMRPDVDPTQALAAFGVRPGVDAVWAGEQVVYFQRLSAERTRSRLSTVMSHPLYADMTIRNWKTVTTLCTMLAA